MNKFCSFMLVMLIAASTSLFAADAPKQDYYQNQNILPHVKFGYGFHDGETYPQYAYKANDFYIHSDSPSRENWDCSESTPQRTTLSDVRRKDVRCTG